MHVVVAGGHGQIALLLHPLLRERGHDVRGLIRNPEQARDLWDAGAEPVLCDLEAHEDISEFVGVAAAVVFAAGAGPGSGAARKWTVDRDGALKLIGACHRNGIRRYLMVSAMNVERPRGDGVFRTYQQAKAEADAALRASGLEWTILRPGRLTDGPPTGKVALSSSLPSGQVPRADVAAVIAELLERPDAAGHQLDLTSGARPVAEAVHHALAQERAL